MSNILKFYGLFVLGLFGFTSSVLAEVNQKEFSTQNPPHLPSSDVMHFEDGRDYFSYQEPIEQAPRADKKIRIQFFFDYDCRVCSSAQDILELYNQMRTNKVALEQYPIATADSQFSARVFYTLQALSAGELSNVLLFETSEKSRYAELSATNKIQQWVEEQALDKQLFIQAENSERVKEQIQDAIELTEEYGVFTYPYVVIGGKYVLTASTLYNDDYSVAVLDFLVNKIGTKVMKIGIVGAMAQEVEILKNLMAERTETRVASAIIFEGKINGKDVALLQSGIGKVAAAIGTTALLQLAKPDFVINTGSAGGVAKGLKVGDIVISDETRYHDADVTAFGYEKGQLPANPAAFLSDKKLSDLAQEIAEKQGQSVKRGLICSGDSFINSEDKIAQIKADFPNVMGVEMEATAIAQVCYAFNVPFVVVRAISDAGNGEASMSFEEFLPLAAKQSSSLVLGMIDRL